MEASRCYNSNISTTETIGGSARNKGRQGDRTLAYSTVALIHDFQPVTPIRHGNDLASLEEEPSSFSCMLQENSCSSRLTEGSCLT